MSERITFTADEDTVAVLGDVEERDDIDSTAAAVRECITEYARLQRECEALQHAHDRELEQLEQTIDRLRNEKRVLTDAYQINDDTQEIVRYRKEREKAGLVGRAKLWLFGRD